MFVMMADIEPLVLGKALERIKDSRTRDGSAGGTFRNIIGTVVFYQLFYL